MNMIRQGVTLRLRSDTLKRVFRASKGILLGQHVVRMVINNGKGLDNLLEVLNSGGLELTDPM
jgi:hypothetical protein